LAQAWIGEKQNINMNNVFIKMRLKLGTWVNFSFPVLLSLFLFGLAACSKNDGEGSSGERRIEYKLTALAGVSRPLNFVSFTNETGGRTDLTNISLPFTQAFTRTVETGDDATLSFSYNNGNGGTMVSIRLEILVNGTVVKSETINSNTASVIGAIAHVFVR
jgi:hypothetical protein